MRPYAVIRYLALTFLLLAVFMGTAVAIAWRDQTPDFFPLLYTTLISAIFGIFPLIFVPASGSMNNKEGLMVVVLSWLVAIIFGALPFTMYGEPFSPVNALFESASGFTTTGASILTDVEALPRGLLWWRGMTHWLGGVGIVIFALALLPFLGFSEVLLYRKEISNLVRENLQYRARRAVQILASVYIGLTLAETLFLMLAGMNFFDAATHSFATIATGGFSTRNASVHSFDSAWIESIIMVFMVLSGIHFALLFTAIRGDPGRLWRSPVTRYYLVAIAVGVAVMTIDIHVQNGSPWMEALRYGSFNLISIGTSTGFATADTNLFPAASKLLLVLFMLQCACSGSTSGGIKADRIVILWKSLVRRVRQVMHPRAFLTLRMGDRILEDSMISHALLYVLVYLTVLVAGTVLISLSGVRLEEAFSGAAAAMGNVGPGFGAIGSLGNYASLSAFAKSVLMVLMIAGRLEIYALIIFLTPNQWKKQASY